MFFAINGIRTEKNQNYGWQKGNFASENNKRITLMGKPKKTILIICICAVVIYILAFPIFPLAYRYDKYWIGEGNFTNAITSAYCLVVFCVVMFVLVRSWRKSQIEKNSDDVATDNLPLEKVEEPKAVDMSVEETPENKDADKNSQYIGTGVVGLERWNSYCLIVGQISLFSGYIFLLVAVSAGVYFAMAGIAFIIGGISCIISTPFIKALITIVKAAKLYIDNNQKEEAQ